MNHDHAKQTLTMTPARLAVIAHLDTVISFLEDKFIHVPHRLDEASSSLTQTLIEKYPIIYDNWTKERDKRMKRTPAKIYQFPKQ
jgi:hypothetical protein